MSKKDEKTKDKKGKVKEKNLDYKDAWMRATADYQNLQKEMEAKRKEWVDYANQGLLEDLIPVIENFYQGLKYIPEEYRNKDWMIGFQQIQKQLEGFMESKGITRIKTVGEKFDPDLHEAVDHKESAEESDTILEEVMGGYKLNGKVVQVAKVIVAE